MRKRRRTHQIREQRREGLTRTDTEGDTSTRYAVERLLGKRIAIGRSAGDTHRKGTVLYHVKWRGLDESEASWEPKSYLTPDLVAAYEQQQQERAQPDAPVHVEDVD